MKVVVVSAIRRQYLVLWVALLYLSLAAGCATTSTSPGGQRDPWENWNRKVFNFNEGLDTRVLKPVATAYHDTVPEFVRTSVGNVFRNINDAWSAINSFLQGKGRAGLTDTMRFSVNSTLGLLGVLDIATEMGLERHEEDFGQTLGKWGAGSGPYIVWPLFGPSTVRDSIALPLDRAASPALLIDDGSAQFGVSVLQIVDTRSNLLNASKVLDDIALDKYTFVRDAYLTRRRSLIYDGDTPDGGGASPYAPAGGSQSSPAGGAGGANEAAPPPAASAPDATYAPPPPAAPASQPKR